MHRTNHFTHMGRCLERRVIYRTERLVLCKYIYFTCYYVDVYVIVPSCIVT